MILTPSEKSVSSGHCLKFETKNPTSNLSSKIYTQLGKLGWDYASKQEMTTEQELSYPEVIRHAEAIRDYVAKVSPASTLGISVHFMEAHEMRFVWGPQAIHRPSGQHRLALDMKSVN